MSASLSLDKLKEGTIIQKLLFKYFVESDKLVKTSNFNNFDFSIRDFKVFRVSKCSDSFRGKAVKFKLSCEEVRAR